MELELQHVNLGEYDLLVITPRNQNLWGKEYFLKPWGLQMLANTPYEGTAEKQNFRHQSRFFPPQLSLNFLRKSAKENVRSLGN